MEKILGTFLDGKIDIKNSNGFHCVLNIENGKLSQATDTCQVINGNINQMEKLRKNFYNLPTETTNSTIILKNENGFYLKKEICIWGINNGIWFSDKDQTAKLYRELGLDKEDIYFRGMKIGKILF